MTVLRSLALFLLCTGTAQATETIQLRLHNQTPDSGMTCRVYRVVKNTSNQDVATQIGVFRPKPKNQRPASVRDQPESFNLAVKHIARRIDRTLVHPRLRLKCKIDGTTNTENQSPLWQPPYGSKKFIGSCRPGAYCITRIQ